MGMEYHLRCRDCNASSSEIEYSVVGYVELKFPDDAEENLVEWTKFLVAHSGHKIAFVDGRENTTDPSKICGHYVLGLTNKQDGLKDEVKP